VAIDGQGFPGVDNAGPPRVDINGRGEGYAGSALGGTAFGAVLKDRNFNAGVPLGPSFPSLGLPVAAVDEAGDGLVAWQAADLTIHARAYDNVRASRTVQAPQRDTPLSNLGAGPADAANGLEAAADRAGDAAVAFAQGVPGNKAIMVASSSVCRTSASGSTCWQIATSSGYVVLP